MMIWSGFFSFANSHEGEFYHYCFCNMWSCETYVCSIFRARVVPSRVPLRVRVDLLTTGQARKLSNIFGNIVALSISSEVRHWENYWSLCWWYVSACAAKLWLPNAETLLGPTESRTEKCLPNLQVVLTLDIDLMWDIKKNLREAIAVLDKNFLIYNIFLFFFDDN